MLVPLDRSVVFLAKATSNLLFLLAVEVIAVPLFYFFFMTSVPLAESAALVLAPLVVGTVGVAGIGTLAVHHHGEHAREGRHAGGAVHPAGVPAALRLRFGYHGGRRGSGGLSGRVVPSMALAAGYDVVMLLASWVLYDFVSADGSPA